MMLDTALKLAANGWPVFPCKPGAKVPATEHGFKDATTDPAVIRRWWTRLPLANVAIATGQPGPDVLDIDVKGAGDGMAALQRLEAAGLVVGALGIISTPSGGLHMYFRGTRQGNGSIAKHGVDFRGLGGYVVTVPSLVDGRAYELLEWRAGARGTALDWAACKALLDPPRRRSPASFPTSGDASDDLSSLGRWLARQPEGGRNNACFWAACRAVETGHESQLGVILDAAIAAGLPEWEARRTVESARRKVGAA